MFLRVFQYGKSKEKVLPCWCCHVHRGSLTSMWSYAQKEYEDLIHLLRSCIEDSALIFSSSLRSSISQYYHLLKKRHHRRFQEINTQSKALHEVFGNRYNMVNLVEERTCNSKHCQRFDIPIQYLTSEFFHDNIWFLHKAMITQE